MSKRVAWLVVSKECGSLDNCAAHDTLKKAKAWSYSWETQVRVEYDWPPKRVARGPQHRRPDGTVGKDEVK